MKLISCLLFLFSSYIFSSSLDYKEVVQKCDSEYSSCNVSIYNNNVLEKEILNDYPYESKIKRLDSGDFLIISSCGSPCSNYIFVNVKLNEAYYYENPIEFDDIKDIFVFLEEGNIKLKKVFSNKNDVKTYFIEDLASTASPVSAIEKVEFEGENKILVYYLNSDFDSKMIEFEYTFSS